MAAVLDSACGKTDLVSVELTVDLRRIGGGLKGARNHLEGLLERQFALR